jgi:hypothetical protein
MGALFRKKKKQDLEFWNKELLRLEQNREKILKDVEHLEASKGEYFELGRKEASYPKKVIFAEKIKNIDGAVKAHNERLGKHNKQIELINQIIIKMKSAEDVRITDFQLVLTDIEKIHEDEQIWKDKFETAHQEIEAMVAKSDGIAVDPQTQDILNMFEKTKDQEIVLPEVAKPDPEHVKNS